MPALIAFNACYNACSRPITVPPFAIWTTCTKISHWPISDCHRKQRCVVQNPYNRKYSIDPTSVALSKYSLRPCRSAQRIMIRMFTQPTLPLLARPHYSHLGVVLLWGIESTSPFLNAVTATLACMSDDAAGLSEWRSGWVYSNRRSCNE